MLKPETTFAALMAAALFRGAERHPERDDGADKAYRTYDGLALRVDLAVYDRGERAC